MTVKVNELYSEKEMNFYKLLLEYGLAEVHAKELLNTTNSKDQEAITRFIKYYACWR